MDNETKPNLKRKRGEGAKEDRGTKVSGKMHHELHEVHHACKKAKTFETQKLVKRLKQLREKGEDDAVVQDHEAQLSAIKAIDANKLANTVFKSKCHKDKTLRENGMVQEALKKEIQTNVLETPAAGTPLAKVQSRLLSSKIIASQVATSIALIKALVNPDVPPPTKKARPKSLERTIPLVKSRKDTSAPKPTKPSLLAGEGDSSHEEGDAAGDLGWESGTVDEDDDGQGEDEASGDDGWEPGSIPGSDSGPDDDDGSSEDEDDRQVKARPKQAKSAPPPTASSKSKAESTFLPSLAMGYISGSDASDVDEPSGVEPRKNRRGQRARRAIWEKKFGRNANHKKKEAMALEEKKAKAFERAQARYQKSAATPRPDSGWGSRGSAAEAPARSSSGQNVPPLKKQTSDKPIHPSWEAKRKLKEKQSDAIVPSQGKKIKF